MIVTVINLLVSVVALLAASGALAMSYLTWQRVEAQAREIRERGRHRAES